MASPTRLIFSTELGQITLALLPTAAPITVAHVVRNVADGLYNACTFYRSDFVIQCGVYSTAKASRHPPLAVNESGVRSNLRGTMSVAHHDVPDCGSTEIFINLVDSPHLDKAYGGYCVFAAVAAEDAASWACIAKIAEAVKAGRKPVITSAVAQ
jgi:cyclophilin family peptidyl-prolyl cis-trans isomerase